jgi:hypothetical protein
VRPVEQPVNGGTYSRDSQLDPLLQGTLIDPSNLINFSLIQGEGQFDGKPLLDAAVGGVTAPKSDPTVDLRGAPLYLGDFVGSKRQNEYGNWYATERRSQPEIPFEAADYSQASRGRGTRNAAWVPPLDGVQQRGLF